MRGSRQTMRASLPRWSWCANSSRRALASGRGGEGRQQKLPTARSFSPRSGVLRRHHHGSTAAAGRLLVTVARAFHHGRRPVAPCSGLHASVNRPDLQGQPPGQLGPQDADHDLDLESSRASQAACGTSAIGGSGEHRGGDDPARDGAGDTGVAVHPTIPSGGAIGARPPAWSAVAFRSGHSIPTGGFGGGEDFAGLRFQRLRGRPPASKPSAFDKFARLNDGAEYRGLTASARKRVVADMEEAGLVEKIEPHSHTVPLASRRRRRAATEQWYADAKARRPRADRGCPRECVTFMLSAGAHFSADETSSRVVCASCGGYRRAWYGPDEGVRCAVRGRG